MKPPMRTSGRVLDCSWTGWAASSVNDSDSRLWEPTTLPVDDGQVVRVHRPFKGILFGLELLQLHRQPALVDLSLREDAEMAREPKPTANRDEPFGRVPLVPFHSVPVVHRELVMKVMVTLAEGHKRRNQMVSRRVLIIKCAFPQPMSQGVDGKGGLRNFTSVNPEEKKKKDNVGPIPHMMNGDHSKETGIKVPATPVTPEIPGNERGDDYSPN